MLHKMQKQTQTTLTPEFEKQLRAAINPIYATTMGTESYERRILLAEIDRLRGLLAAEKDEAELRWS